MPKLILTVGFDKEIEKKIKEGSMTLNPSLLKLVQDALHMVSSGSHFTGFTMEFSADDIETLHNMEGYLKFRLADRHDFISAVVQQKHDKAELPRKLDMPRPMERVWAKEDRSE